MNRRSFLVLSAALGAAMADAVEPVAMADAPVAMADAVEPDRESLPNRPKVPGTLHLRARRREERPPGSGKIRVYEEALRWDVANTAIIIVDMWDTHTCLCAAQRVAAMAPVMNQVVSAARSLGVMIIHAPSDTMKYYEGTPWRRRMQQAPMAPSPIPVRATDRTPDEARNFPIADGCDDPVPRRWTGPAPPTTRGNYPWEREHPAIQIVGYDGISDSGQEIYNFCKQEGITNIVLMGVHANICIMNRAFGCREMTRLGFHVVVARDLVDAMYDPRQRPFVSHARGTELVVEFIEANWCPSILGEDLKQVISGTESPHGESPSAAKDELNKMRAVAGNATV
ncbi:MAG: isochorismatase family protein [Verrucomicrobiota bacterium]